MFDERNGEEGMRRTLCPRLTTILVLLLTHAALAAPSTVVLAVEGMT